MKRKTDTKKRVYAIWAEELQPTFVHNLASYQAEK
jgi:hypothetical protein